MQDRRKTILLLSAIGAVVIAIIVILIIGLSGGKTQSPAPETPLSEPQSGGSQGKRIIDVQRQVLINDIEEGICDMGLLVTQEYYFTDAVTQSKIKTLFSIPLGFTETSYVATYDGVVTAGLDFSLASVSLDPDGRTVTVSLPKAEIQSVDIDPNSFVLYSEKHGFGNPLSVSEFNGSLADLENRAKERAAERGVIEKADENARKIVSNFIGGLLDPDLYDIIWA
jgi:hypothetical protein